MRLAERFGQWPLATPAGEMTAAMVAALGEALAERKTATRTAFAEDGQTATVRHKRAPRMPMSRLKLLDQKMREAKTDDQAGDEKVG